MRFKLFIDKFKRSEWNFKIKSNIVTIQNDKNFVYLHKRNFEISNNRLANEKIRDLTNAMLSRGTKNAS